MPELTISQVISFATALAAAVGAFAAVRAATKEQERLLMALHRRFDGLEKDVRSLELQQARFDERVKRLRDTQRFKLVGGPPAEEPDA